MATTPTLNFVLFYVSNLEESLKYFTQTLGLEHDPKQDAPIFRGFAGGAGCGLAPAGVPLPWTAEIPQPGAIEVYFETDNLEGLHTSLASKGVQVTEITHQPFGSIFSIPAPDGQMVTMIRPPAR